MMENRRHVYSRQVLKFESRNVVFKHDVSSGDLHRRWMFQIRRISCHWGRPVTARLVHEICHASKEVGYLWSHGHAT